MKDEVGKGVPWTSAGQREDLTVVTHHVPPSRPAPVPEEAAPKSHDTPKVGKRGFNGRPVLKVGGRGETRGGGEQVPEPRREERPAYQLCEG